ncbi:AAA family ATPase [Paenibacillus xylanexedens]|uniref:AAA family ATPase n=1 Tax=Paenibacillus xylanexedens TaxID=528191 RepID=UPI003D024E83
MEDLAQSDRIMLKAWLNESPVVFQTFLYMAISITEQVHAVHKQGSVLGNLNPAHIWIDLETHLAVIEEMHETDYVYISPEQTGRLNHRPDERSDLYVLGLIYYEMLTGKAPFLAESAEEYGHAHLAMVPIGLRELRPELSESLEAIIMKLLSKSPDERYQSTYGLLMDLKICLSSFIEEGYISPFDISRADEASRFRLPRTLFGCEREEDKLREGYEQVRSGESVLMLVSGQAGSGKTALIRQFQMQHIKECSLFLEAKCEPKNHDVPFSPILQVLRKMIKHTLGEAPERVDMVKTRLAKGSGQGAGVLAALLPEVQALIGEIPAVEALPPAEATIRLHRLVPIFIKAFIDREHSLVLFLDDLQWADSATLEVLRTIVHDKVLQGLFIIGTFREEVMPEGISSSNPEAAATVWVENALSLNGSHTPISFQHITLSPLSYNDIRRFVSQTLNENTVRIRLLAESLYHRTGGNPLFLHRLLDSLYRERKIYFDEESSMWTWEEAIVTEMPSDLGVLHFIGERIRKLPTDQMELLVIAAAIGHRFPPSTLALASGRSVPYTRQLLQIYEEKGLLYREFDAHETEDTYYRFLHDRVQQAAYMSVPESAKAALHLKIGRVLRANSSSQQEEAIFDMVYHLNLGMDEMVEESERKGLAEYNLQAGLKSKAATAYAAALHYFEVGLRLVKDDEKRTDSLVYRLLLEMPECEYMCGRQAAAEELLNRLMSCTTDLVERSQIYLIRIGMYSYLKKNDMAVQIGRQALEEFGWKLALKPHKAVIVKEVMLTQIALHNNRKNLAHLPINRDPHYKALSDLIMAISTSVFTISLELAAMLFSRFIRYGLKHGNNEAFAFILAGYGLVILRNKISLSRTGLHYIDTAILLSASFDSMDLQCRLNYIGGLARLQQNPKEGFEHLEKSMHYGMESANLTYVSISMLTSVTTHIGDLYALTARISAYEEISQMLVDEETHSIFRIARWYIAKLQGEVEESDQIILPLKNSRSEETLNNDVYYLCTCQIEIAYLEGQYRDALDWVEEGRFNTFRQTRMQVRKQHIYHSLTLAAMYDDSPEEEREHIRSRLTRLLHSMKNWTGYYGNQSSAYLLVTAELKRINGHRAAATKGYDEAIRTARLESHSLMEGISLERAAIFYREAGSSIGANTLMADACAAYSSWGAMAKVRELKETYRELGSVSNVPVTPYRMMVKEVGVTLKRERTPIISSERTLLQQISEWSSTEINETVLRRFLETVIRHSGAVKGYILNSNEGRFSITDQAGGSLHAQEAIVYAESIARYVIKTGEAVMLADASRSFYAADSYIRRVESKSALCMPILVPGKPLLSVLYLENNFISGVFTKEVMDMLDLMITRMVYLKSLEESHVLTIASSDAELPLAVPSTEERTKLLEQFSKREKEILHALMDGLSNKEIANHLGLTEGTVKSYVYRIYGKLGVNRRAHAIAQARELL